MIVAAELASSAVRFFERVSARAPDGSGSSVGLGALARAGLSPDEVRRLAESSRPLTAEETRRSLAKLTRRARRGAWGRGGLPDHVVRAMHAEYRRPGGSCSTVAKIFGGTRQSVFDVFKSHGLALRKRRALARIVYRGAAFTSRKDGYYRATVAPREPLHHRVWCDANGTIPDGCQVMFADGDRANCSLENLRCAPAGEVLRDQPRRALLRKARAA